MHQYFVSNGLQSNKFSAFPVRLGVRIVELKWNISTFTRNTLNKRTQKERARGRVLKTVKLTHGYCWIYSKASLWYNGAKYIYIWLLSMGNTVQVRKRAWGGSDESNEHRPWLRMFYPNGVNDTGTLYPRYHRASVEYWKYILTEWNEMSCESS